MAIFRGGLLPRLIALFPALVPLYLVRGSFLEIPVNFPELVLGLLALGFCFEHPPFRAYEWRLWAVFAFLLAAFLGVAFVPETLLLPSGLEFPSQLRALGILKGWILAPLLYFFMARATFKEKPSLVRWALQAAVVGGWGLAVWAMVQMFTGEYLTPDGRASGPFESANYLALYLGPLLVYAVIALREAFRGVDWASFKARFLGDRVLSIGFLLSSIGILGVALYGSQSYASWIAILGTLGLWALMEAWALSRRAVLFMSLFFGMLAVALVASQWGTPKFEQALDFTGQSSSSVRLQIYEVAGALIQDHPVFGIGLGQFEQYYSLYAASILGQAPLESVMLHAHNLFLMTWLSMGLLGLGSLLVLVGQGLLWLTERDRHGRFIAAFMLLEVLIHGLFDTPLFKNDLAFEAWLLLAILL